MALGPTAACIILLDGGVAMLAWQPEFFRRASTPVKTAVSRRRRSVYTSKTFESAISEERGCILVTPFAVRTNLSAPTPPRNVLSGRKPEMPMQTEISRPHSSVSEAVALREHGTKWSPEELFQSDM